MFSGWGKLCSWQQKLVCVLGSNGESAQGERYVEAGWVQTQSGEGDYLKPTKDSESASDKPPNNSGIQNLFLDFFFSLQTNDSAQNSNFMFFQASLERSETETRQRLNNQLEKQEREISQLQKRLEHEAEQRHLLSRNQEVRQNFCFLLPWNRVC